MEGILVIGGSGLLGQYMVREGRRLGLDIGGTFLDNMPEGGGTRMDITDPSSVAEGLRAADPDAVVLTAAMTNVDQCEREPSKAYSINMEGTMNVVHACKEMGIRLAYVSTDYVFNGLKGGRYDEFDSPDPLSIYAKSKLEGERLVIDGGKDNLICRVSVVYGWNALGKDNFVTWVIRMLRDGQPIRLYEDQHVSPTYAKDASHTILQLLGKGCRGVYHTSGPDCLSRFEMGEAIAEEFALPKALLTGVRTKDMPMLAVRPPVSCLNVERSESELERGMTPLREGLKDMRSSLQTREL